VMEWVSPGPSTDILPGFSGTFSFLSPLPPVSQNYLAIGFSDTGIDFNRGTTVGPGSAGTAVPEPPTFLLFSSALPGLIWYGWRRRADRSDCGRTGRSDVRRRPEHLASRGR
jgi:hypothetical protein